MQLLPCHAQNVIGLPVMTNCDGVTVLSPSIIQFPPVYASYAGECVLHCTISTAVIVATVGVGDYFICVE